MYLLISLNMWSTESAANSTLCMCIVSYGMMIISSGTKGLCVIEPIAPISPAELRSPAPNALVTP